MKIITTDFSITCPSCGRITYPMLRRVAVMGYDYLHTVLVEEKGSLKLYPGAAERVDYNNESHICLNCYTVLTKDELMNAVRSRIAELPIGSEAGTDDDRPVLESILDSVQNEIYGKGWSLPDPIEIER